MACPSCAKNRKAANAGVFISPQSPYPFRANDLRVVEGLAVRNFRPEDWDNDRHKLLIFIPEAFTPVCQTEIGAVGHWREEFLKLGCDLIVAGSDPAARFADWYSQEKSLFGMPVLTFSSYLLPSRLGLVESGRVRRSSVFVMAGGEVVKQEHFDKVGRSFSELHRMLFGHSTGSYCAEGWQSPEDGFLIKS